MKHLIRISFLIVLLVVVGCRRNRTVQYVRIPVDTTTIKSNDLPTMEDVDGYIDDDEGLMELPDIPQERPVNMRSDDYELEKIMRGEGE